MLRPCRHTDPKKRHTNKKQTNMQTHNSKSNCLRIPDKCCYQDSTSLPLAGCLGLRKRCSCIICLTRGEAEKRVKIYFTTSCWLLRLPETAFQYVQIAFNTFLILSFSFFHLLFLFFCLAIVFYFSSRV